MPTVGLFYIALWQQGKDPTPDHQDNQANGRHILWQYGKDPTADHWDNQANGRPILHSSVAIWQGPNS
jgi:hypothetical protein